MEKDIGIVVRLRMCKKIVAQARLPLLTPRGCLALLLKGEVGQTGKMRILYWLLAPGLVSRASRPPRNFKVFQVLSGITGILLMLTVLSDTAHAQVGAAARGLGYLNQTDVAASLYGSFAGTTTANGVVQSPSNAAGVLLELRHLSNPLVGYELNYSYNRDDQKYNTSPVKAVAHEAGADWVVSFGLPVLPIRLFGLAGGGILFVQPDSGQAATRSNTKGVFVYGAGLDYALIPHLGLRLQYRGNLYRAPDLLNAVSSTRKFTTTSQPMLGAYFRF